jgi:hypothetical protein
VAPRPATAHFSGRSVPARFRRLLSAGLLLAASNLGGREVDHRYAPLTWHSALGLPEDWHKPLADERGALLYDFGPGPYAQPLTTIAFQAGDAAPERTRQWLDAARVPIVRTSLGQGDAAVDLTTLAVPPERIAGTNGRFDRYERLDGISGALGWARPAEPSRPEFRHVAWGTNRPIRYRIRVDAGAGKRVALGFCESYKPRLGERVARMEVEGAEPQTADLALTAARNGPQVFLFEAADADRDGWLQVTVSAPAGRDPNTTLALLTVYPAGTKLTRDDLIGGPGAGPDHAELRIACGTEALAQPARVDAMRARFAANSQPRLIVRSGRDLRADEAGGLSFDATPFLRTQPRATRVIQRNGRWELHFPRGTREATALVFSGAITTAEADARTERFDFEAAAAAVRQRWAAIDAPQGRVTVGDRRLQDLVEASIRTVYQARESINGIGQFNSSFTLYRGLWSGDAVYFIELAALLGDFARARETLDTIFSFQNSIGLIGEMPPLLLYRVTPATLWALERYVALSGDRASAERHWPAVRRAVEALRAARDTTLQTPGAANAGLLPAGFNDGGIADITAEYSSVYWTLTGLPAIARTARRLGREADATAITQLAGEMTAAFQRAMTRDLRTDRHGNRYLPVRVGQTAPDDVPQLAQWAVVEHLLFGEGLTFDAPLARGTIAMLEAAEKQGLTHSTGWMRDGIWAGYGALYGHLPLLQGRSEKAADVLYAVANHASPAGTWVEEQSPVGAPPKLAGDQPHCWASALFVRLAASMLACERAGTVHLLSAVPPEWLRPGAVNRLDAYRTADGPLSLDLTVGADGRTALLRIEPPTAGRIHLYTTSLAAAGFRLEGTTEGTIPLEVPPGRNVTYRFRR